LNHAENNGVGIVGCKCSGGLGQGNLGQIAFGGCWQTTLTLINQNTATTANVAISFYGDNGSPLSAPVQGVGIVASYKFTIQPGNRQDVILFDSDASSSAVERWANVATTGDVALGGQGSFLCRVAGRPDYQAVVPLTAPKSSPCLVPFPPATNPVILVPFDDTAGQYTTSIAIANTTHAAQSIAIEFDDASNSPLLKDTLALGPMQHLAFATTDRYPQLAGTKGILRVFADPADAAVLGLLFNSTGPFTTILPVTQ
jgi:hypothetical protein